MSATSTSAPTQTAQPPLLPTLYALLPPSAYSQVISSLSLQAIHAETTSTTDSFYTTTNPVLSGQNRILRLRQIPPKSASHNSNGERPKADNNRSKRKDTSPDKPSYQLAYLSSPLSGREYSQASVRAVVELGVMGMSTLPEIEDFIDTLGFSYSHQYTRSGLLFHLPLPFPNLTLHLSITRLTPDKSSPPPDSAAPSEPYLVQLHPSRPISGIANNPGEVSLSDVMDLMTSVVSRIDGLEWGTGR